MSNDAEIVSQPPAVHPAVTQVPPPPPPSGAPPPSTPSPRGSLPPPPVSASQPKDQIAELSRFAQDNGIIPNGSAKVINWAPLPPIETLVHPENTGYYAAQESLFVDLRPYLNGTVGQEVPSVAEVWPGRSLFYAGRLNEIHGEPSVGKTNINIAAANAVLREGGTVLYIDPEDTPRGFASRALALGGDADAIAERLHYLHNPSLQDIVAAQAWAAMYTPTMVILDGFAEALAAAGLNEDVPADVLSYFRTVLRPFAEAGAAVVVADHVTKSLEGRGRWARGSGAKLGRYDGAVYEIVLCEPYTPSQAGFVRLKISKDRNGGAGAMGQTVCEIHFTPGVDTTVVEFRQPAEKGTFRPTAIIDKIVAHLQQNGEANKTALRRHGKSEYVDQAVDLLMAEGVITRRREGQQSLFSLNQ